MAVEKELEKGTTAVVSCEVTGITKVLDNIVWVKDGSNVMDLPGNAYTVNSATFDLTSFSQTTTLTVDASATTEDTTYKCVITSVEWDDYDRETPVSLNVFSE